MFTLFNKRILYGFFLVALVLGIQMPGIQRPFCGHYASYQATVMASISRNMLRENFSELMLPKTDMIIHGKRSLHLNQYPFPSLIAALGVKIFGGTFEFWGRFQAIIFNLLSIAFLGLVATKLFSAKVGWISASIYAFSPYTLIYGQSFMSESLSAFFLIFSLYLLLRTAGDHARIFSILCAALSFSVAVTGRIHFLIFYPVYLLCLSWAKVEKKVFRFLLFSIVAFALPAAWYAYTYFISAQFDNVHTNIFLQIGAQRFSVKQFLTSFVYWKIIFDILSQTLLTPLLFPFFFLGFALMKKNGVGFWVTASWVFGGLLVVFLASEKVLKHDFYLYGAFPFIVVAGAYGVASLLEAFPMFQSNRIVVILVVLYLGSSIRFFFHPIFKCTDQNKNMLAIVQFVQKNTTANDRVIVAGDDPGALLYYIDREVWDMQLRLTGSEVPRYLKGSGLGNADSSKFELLQEAMKNPVDWFEYLKESGFSYFVVPNKNELNSASELLKHLRDNYRVISTDQDQFYLFKITSDPKKN